MSSHQNQLIPQYKPNTESIDSQSSSQQDSQNAQLEPQQIQKALRTLKKLKKISKNRKLTQAKQNSTKVNQMFKRMSQFFLHKSKAAMEIKKEKDKIRNARKQALKAAGIRKFPRPQTLMEDISDQSMSFNPIQEFTEQLNQSKTEIKSSKCYICKKPFTSVHHFYDCMCIECGDFNYQKRSQSVNLSGFVALVTGARIKIGFKIALKLLRDGATVIATTRFFKDAFLRYKKQKDFQNWKQRLFITECDFTSSPQVAKLIETVKHKFSRLDILINNAAQTIVRPKQFYLQQLSNQTKEIPSLPAHLKPFHPTDLPINHRYPSLFLPQQQSKLLQIESDQSPPMSPLQKMQQSGKNLVNHDIRDSFDQPLDIRETNSWVQNLEDVSLIDCFTTQLVNSIVPFHLINQLKPLMKKSLQQKPSYIINVSSMEGIFYRSNKQSTHPHTNMAKAALNMITRTSARQFTNDCIYMNSVDTGWVTEQNPQPYKLKLDRLIPLDCVDGAMRVLDPIYLSVEKSINVFGKFLKDYKESSW